MEKLNLDGLAHWSPENAVVVRELVLAYHDVFVLESNELGCTSAIEYEIRIKNGEPFKEWFQCIPLPLLEEIYTSLRDMLKAGVIHPSQSPWCNTIVLVQEKDGTLLHGLQVPQCTYKEGLIPFALHSGDLGKHGAVSTFLINGFQVRLLANQDGPGITTIHGLYSR